MNTAENKKPVLEGRDRIFKQVVQHNSFYDNIVSYRIIDKTWWDRLKMTLAIGTIILVVATIVTSLVIGLRNWNLNISEKNCSKFGTNTGYEVEHFVNSFWDYGCYVDFNGNFVSKEDIYLTVGD